MATEQKVTEEQAGEALRALMTNTPMKDLSAPETTEPEPAAESTPAPAPVESEPATEPAEVEASAAEVPSDDVESLRKRLKEVEDTRESAIKAASDRTEAIQSRSRQNETILRERLLKKSSAVDRALKTLKQARSSEGVPEAEVDRIIAEIQATMNPQSASYTPVPEPPTYSQEDAAIVLNDFLNEKGMSNAESDKFGSWMRTEASESLSQAEQAIANRDLDGFLRVAYNRFNESARTKESQRNETVAAVKSVQRTQREAARAASSSPTAPRKQPTGANNEIDVKKLTHEDVDKLLRMSVEQYK
jgi:hypothetical protein